MKNEVIKRKIDYLWHFTKLENIDSILNNGLVPRANLEDQGINISYNDLYRFDGQKIANCMSIQHPNYKMFYHLRQKNLEQKWVVIAFEPEILWLKDCAFCNGNAASNNVTSIPIDQRKGITAFREIFANIEGKPDRVKLMLTDNYPTNPQAEVLIFDTIEPKYIKGIVTSDNQLKISLKEAYPDFRFLFNSGPFSPRLDYRHW